ncbi:acetyltransferase, GNAT family [Shewanella violacea DSS12]|uniref:Acetyltransferase, GNAT family n=2 Tax=Shewanella violacea TaxID=60217 RepID=D4ZHT0_SHEVD|nr:acetyltransferase, GNAT family [Shewanella violacea DSS12]
MRLVMEQIVLETERLILRPFKSSDAEQVAHLAGDPKVSGPTLNIPYPYTLDMARGWISSHAPRWLEGSGLIYAVTGKDTGRLLGTVSLVQISGRKAELGYWFGVPFWGSGYCSEAVAALIDFSFGKLGITLLNAEHLASNPASGRVMAKNGMKLLACIDRESRDGLLSKVETYELKCP